MLKVLDNFLGPDTFKSLEDVFLSNKLPWYYNPCIAEEKKGLDQYQLIHPFFDIHNPYLEIDKSPFCNVLKPLFIRLQPLSILRVKANLRPRTSVPILSSYHIDSDLNNITAIYYLNTNNGFTLFKNGTKIDSIANRMLIFSSDMLHCGASCTDKHTRVVLNINYIPGMMTDSNPFIPSF